MRYHYTMSKQSVSFHSTPASASQSELKQGKAADIMTGKIDMPMLLQVIASISIPVILTIFAFVALINPQFANQQRLIIENRDSIAALDKKLSGEIAALDTKLSARIVALDIKLSGEIAALDSKLSGEIAALDIKLSDRITALDIKLSDRITALDIKLSDRITALDSKLSGEIAALDSKLSGEIARLDNRFTVEVARLDSKFDALANLMIVALSNGEPTEAELVAVWESILSEE